MLAPANYNSPAQVVVAGTVAAIERVEAAWKDAGKRASRLATSGAFHSPLMEQARAPFNNYLETVKFQEPAITVICNTDATPLDASNVRERLVEHLTKPVRFQQSIELLDSRGVNAYVEVGFGGVLANLVKRCAPEAARLCVQDRASFDECAETYAS